MKTGWRIRGISLLGGLLLLTACASPRMSGELAAGRMAFQEGNYTKAFHDLLPVAKSGRPEAQYAVGYMYYYGYGVQRDVSAGVYWIERASAQHYALASQALDRIHRDGSEPATHSVSDEPVTAGLKDAVSPAATYTATTMVHPPRHKVSPVSKPKPVPASKHALTSTLKVAAKVPGAPCAPLPAQYVLQLYGSWQASHVKQFAAHQGFSHVSVCRTVRDGKDWFVLVTGRYTTAAAAHKARATLPQGMLRLHPWVRPIKDLTLVE